MNRPPAPEPAPSDASSSGRSLWLWVGAAFLFLALLWTAMILAARSTPVEPVPLAPNPLGVIETAPGAPLSDFVAAVYDRRPDVAPHSSAVTDRRYSQNPGDEDSPLARV